MTDCIKNSYRETRDKPGKSIFTTEWKRNRMESEKYAKKEEHERQKGQTHRNL
jgi:hypothetical protein